MTSLSIIDLERAELDPNNEHPELSITDLRILNGPGGGGGTEEVVVYVQNNAPQNPDENTIWVDTSGGSE